MGNIFLVVDERKLKSRERRVAENDVPTLLVVMADWRRKKERKAQRKSRKKVFHTNNVIIFVVLTLLVSLAC